MRISPYLRVNRVEFIVTYQCSGHCKHCSVGENLNRSDGYRHVQAEEATQALRSLSQLFALDSVMTFGGEPLLYPQVTAAIHKAAMEAGIPRRQLISNGYFTRDDALRRQTARTLYAAGANDFLLSVDAFHQETIPLDAVHSFASYCKDAGVPLRLQPAWLVDEEHENPYNTKTKEILLEFSDLDLPCSRGNTIFPAGNAVKYLSEYYGKPHVDLSTGCGAMPYTDPLTEISSLSIEPNGGVSVCSFIIGNIYREDIAEIVARYDPYENRWMRALIEGGGAGLLAQAEREGIYVETEGCYSVCDLCRKVQTAVAGRTS